MQAGTQGNTTDGNAAQRHEAPAVWCVIVNWNGWADTLDCLVSLRAQTHRNLTTVVVDNGSTDDSVQRIRSAFPEVHLVETGSNLGYAKGCNAGIRVALEANAELIWLLNNDTVCPPDTLEKLVGCATAHPEAGLIGSVLLYAHDPTQIQAWGGGRIRPVIGYVKHFTEPAEFTRNCYPTFASVLCRSEVFREVGLLYGGFFMYCDDSDFCLRMQKSTGWKTVIAADTAILHKEGASSKIRDRKPFMTTIVTVSTLRLIRRNSPWYFAGMPVFVMLRMGNRLLRGDGQGVRAVWRGVIQYIREPMPRE